MSDAGPFDTGGPGTTLRGELKQSIRDLNKQETRKGVDVDAVIETTADRTDYTDTDARETLNQMLLDGEVYPPETGRVKVTP